MDNESNMKSTSGAVVGLPLDRVDGTLKVTGGAKYAAEFSVPNLAYAVLVQTPFAKGKVTDIKTEAAEKAPGVIAVITDRNIPKITAPKGMPSGASHPYLTDEVDYSGQNAAIVIAESFEGAEYAAGLVEIVREEEKPSTDMEAHLDEAYTSQGGRMPEAKRGDFDSAFPSAALKVDHVYRTPTEHHNPMEPHATIAIWQTDGTLLVYDATQGVSGAAQTIGRAFGMDAKQVRVVDPFVGGGFGCKGMSWPHSTLCAVAAKVAGRPVKIAISRRQMFTSNGHRPETRQAMRLGADEKGRLVAIDANMINRTAQTADFVEPSGMLANMLYSCPNVHVRHRLVRMDVPPPTFQRAPGEASGSFGIETAMDELAYAAKLDPIELRLLNHADKDESENKPWSSKHLKECYQQASEAFGWSKRTPEPGSMRQGRLLVGYGMATASYPANVRPAAARATLNADGSVLVECGTQDLGTGSYTILAQIAADALGVQMDRVRVKIADSWLPEAGGSGGSTSAASAGSAVMEVCSNLKSDLFNLAVSDVNSPFHGMAADDLQASGGLVTGKNGAPARIETILSKAGQKSLSRETRTEGRPKAPAGGLSYHAFGAQFCEVHVDPDTRMIQIARWVGAFAVGKVLNAKTLQSQLRGGIVFGIGMGLMEESVLDHAYGRFVNSNLAEYHVPVHRDVAPIDIILVEEEDPYVSPVGAKGAGEIGITGAAAAIGNAVYHATGKRVRDLPITLDKIL
jgi:xanthine dehydrogenase YagR molybdenum-binding subunit